MQAFQVIEAPIEVAKELRTAGRRGEELGLNEAEIAFRDALETNDSVVKVLGDENLKSSAQESVEIQRMRTDHEDWEQR